MSSPVPLLTILTTYLYFSLSAGPRWMKDRKPFDLKYVLIVYNALQVAFSIWLVHEVRRFVQCSLTPPPQTRHRSLSSVRRIQFINTHAI